MSVTYSPFMLNQVATGYSFVGKTMGLVLLYRAPQVGATTPNDLIGILGSLGFQEVSTSAVGGSPTYVRTTQAANLVQLSAGPPPVQAVVYGSDWNPIPVGPTAKPVYVAAALFYVQDTVGGVTNPWVMINPDPFDAVVYPGFKLTGDIQPDGSVTRQFFTYTIQGGATIPQDAVMMRSPGTIKWESSRVQHVYLFPQRVNWIPNPSFEAPGPWGWRSDGTMSEVTTGALDGRTYCHTTGKVMESIPVPIQKEYRLSAWVRSSVATIFNMGIWWVDEYYDLTELLLTRQPGDEWPMYATWTRYDAIVPSPDGATAVVPHFECDAAFDIDLTVLESTHAIHPYWDGDSDTGMPGDFCWQGDEAKSYSFWYNNRNHTAGRLFGEYVVDGQVAKLPALVFDWVPTGTSVYTHWNVLSPSDTRHPLKDWGSPVIP